MPFTADHAARCRDDFPALSRRENGRAIAFLDGPAGTQVPQAVIDAIAACYRDANANSHGEFGTSRASDAAIERARETVAAFLGAPSAREISFGQNMTTLNFALSHALMREFRPGDEIVVTALDHEANRGPWLHLQERGIVVREVALLPNGTLDGEDFARQVTEKTRLVAVGLASNALGTVNDVALARRLARGAGAWLLLDAVHYAAHLPVDVAALDADFLLCSAYKFYGPHVGILYCRPGLLDRLSTDRLSVQEPQAPWRIETGTPNFAALAGVAAAIEYIASWGEGETLRQRIVSAMTAIAAYEHDLGERYHRAVSQLPGVTAWGPDFSSSRRAPTVSITVEGRPANAVARHLGDRGIQVWDGHFYAVRAIECLGLAEKGGLLRTGIAMYNTAEEIDRLVGELAALAGA